MAIAAHAGRVIAAPEILFRLPGDVIRDQEIESSVVVVVEPRGARSPPSEVFNSGAPGHIGERAVAVVAVENAAAVAEDEKIGKAVVVVIADGDSHSE